MTRAIHSYRKVAIALLGATTVVGATATAMLAQGNSAKTELPKTVSVILASNAIKGGTSL